MLRFQLSRRITNGPFPLKRITNSSHYIASQQRTLCHLTGPKQHDLPRSNHFNAKQSPRPPSFAVSPFQIQRRGFVAAPSAGAVGFWLKALGLYLFLYVSFKFFSKREERGAKLEILGNHCYSPLHLNSILSLIYPKLLGIFYRLVRSVFALKMMEISNFTLNPNQNIATSPFRGNTGRTPSNPWMLRIGRRIKQRS